MYKMKQILASCAFALFTGIATMSGNAIASTPDGETPANEGVCDGLQGATPGLYGLCVAYCEAQDLDATNKNPPSLKILANYNKKKQAGDPDMPCVQTPCPCFSIEELSAVTQDGIVSACIDSGELIQLIDNSTFDRYMQSDQTGRCLYFDANGTTTVFRNLNTTESQALSCHAQITQACSDTGRP